MNCFIQETYRPIESFITHNHTTTGFVIFNILPYLVQIFQINKTLQTAEVFSVSLNPFPSLLPEVTTILNLSPYTFLSLCIFYYVHILKV